MKNKIKLFTIPLLFAFISLLLAVSCMVLAMLNIANLVFIILSIVFAVAACVLFLVHISLQKGGVNQLDNDKAAIVKALDNISKNEEMGLLNVSNDDEQLVDIARRINKIYLNENVLIPNKFYKGTHFYDELYKLIRRNELVDFVYLRLLGIDKKIYDELIDGYQKRYSHLTKEYIDVVIPSPFERKDIIYRLNTLIEKYPSMRALAAFSMEYSLIEINKYVEDNYKNANPRLQIYEAPEESFRTISYKYACMDLAKVRILNDYLKEIYNY